MRATKAPAVSLKGIKEADWPSVAQQLLAAFPRARVFALSGPLGAGKTSLVRGMVAALGGNPTEVCSPTFVLERRYSLSGARVRELSHWDWYRLDAAEIRNLDVWQRVGKEVVVCVEWPERAPEVWREAPEPFVWVTLREEEGKPDERHLEASEEPSLL